MYRRLTVNTLINLLNMSVNIVIGLALTPFYIHQLGDALYGIWVFALSLTISKGMLVVFDFGIQGSLIKFIAEYKARDEHEHINEVVSAAMISYTGIGILISMGLAGFALLGGVSIFQIPPELLPVAQSVILLMALQTLLDFPAMTATGILEGLQRYDITRGFNIVRLFVFSTMSIVLVMSGMGIFALVIANFCGELVRFIGHFYWVRRAAPFVRLTHQISGDTLKTIFGFSGKLFIFSLTVTIYNQMNPIIISTLLTTTLLTEYEISNRLHTLVFALTTMIGPFMLAAASELNARQDRSELHRLWIRATRYTGVLTVPVAMIVMILTEPLTRYWIGVEYLHTVPVTQLFISYLLYWYLLRAGQNMLIGINRLSVILPAFMISTVINLVISIVAAPYFGVGGVILGTVIGNALALIPYFNAFREQFDVTLYDVWREIILRVYPQAAAGASIVLVLQTLHQPDSLFQVGLYGLAGIGSFTILFILTGMPRDEMNAFTSRLRRIMPTS